jgi:hypothetical protein
VERFAPGQIAVRFDDCVSVAQFENLLRIEAGVNAAEHHVRAALPGDAANFVRGSGWGNSINVMTLLQC